MQPVQAALYDAQGQESADTERQRGEAIVGHRLPNGYMVVHAFRQPCRYCEEAASRPGPRA